MNASRTRLVVAVSMITLLLAVAVPVRTSVLASEPGDRYVVVFEPDAPVDLAGAVAAGGGRVLEVVEEGGFAIVDGMTASSVESLRALNGVSAVEPDLLIGQAGEPGVGAAADPVPTTVVPDDTDFWPRQWDLHEVNAAGAWEEGYFGDSKVRVAVIDTGIDYTHPDLVGRVDLSDDGSVSLLSLACQAGEPGTPALKDEIARAATDRLEEFVDYHSHGTAVAGHIASNGDSLAGVTQRTTLIAIKVNAATNMRQNCVSVYLAAIYEAIDRKADVIHLSFPVEFNKTLFPGTVELINRAMDYAHRKGAVIVAAAGNTPALVDPASDQFRFCNADHVFCVSGTAPTAAASVDGPWTAPRTFWPMSNFGPAIDVAGPAGTAATNRMVWLHCSQYAVAPGRPCTVNNVIWASTGTSFAAATTSGLAAQLVAVVGKNKPDTIEAIIRESAHDLGAPGWDPQFGHGFIDVERALALATKGFK